MDGISAGTCPVQRGVGPLAEICSTTILSARRLRLVIHQGQLQVVIDVKDVILRRRFDSQIV